MCQFHQLSMSSLRQQIQADLTGPRHRAQSIKVGCNFQLSIVVKLGIVLLVKQKLSVTAFAHIKAAHKMLVKLTLQDVVNMKYFKACQQESFRLIPTTMGHMRMLPNDTTIRCIFRIQFLKPNYQKARPFKNQNCFFLKMSHLHSQELFLATSFTKVDC